MKALLKKLRDWWDVVLGVVAAGELVSGHISTLLGPSIGPRVAAGVMLISAITNVYQRTKARGKSTR